MFPMCWRCRVSLASEASRLQNRVNLIESINNFVLVLSRDSSSLEELSRHLGPLRSAQLALPLATQQKVLGKTLKALI